jgi:VWFA-related protein
VRDDFRIREDGAEQQIQHFSRDELPLAVALVIDRSGSVAPVMGRIHDAALETLSQLKPNDEVALFAFAAEVERIESLTADRERIGNAIARLHAGGGTNIADALDEAALYLGRAAKGRRHAIILISDNQGTVRGYASDGQVIRSALETETVIYSVRVTAMQPVPNPLQAALWSPSIGSVKKMTHDTGGEIIDTREAGSIESAMAEVIRRLKMRYTLGYESANLRHDGSFRKIDVQVANREKTSETKYVIFARKGYYAPLDRSALNNQKR